MLPIPSNSRFSPLLCIALACGIGPAPLSAQEPDPPLSPEFFQGRRQALIQAVKARSQDKPALIVLRGAPRRSDMAKFYQDHNFYYLSGVVQENAAMILDCQTGKSTLLVEPYNRWTAQWEGERLVPNEASTKKSGFDEIGNVRSLRRLLRRLLRAEAGQQPVIWTCLGAPANATATENSARQAAAGRLSDPFDRRPSREAAFKEAVEGLGDGVVVRGVDRIIHDLRGVKTPEEIARIRAATEIACAGIAEAMRSTVPGIYEFQVAAAARYVFHRMGAGPDAYAAIVGAGKNGCILHYSANSKRAEDGELIVMDYAPTVQGYASDVTRTFPVNGKFTDEQRKLVQDVHDVQEILIGMIKPGVTLASLSARCRQELSKRGYISAHGPSHHVGLAVHDQGGGTLEPGMLLTVEPGAYLTKKGMGCRIEDVILVTADGHVNLSGHLPSTPDAIEKLMAQSGLQQVDVSLPVPAGK